MTAPLSSSAVQMHRTRERRRNGQTVIALEIRHAEVVASVRMGLLDAAELATAPQRDGLLRGASDIGRLYQRPYPMTALDPLRSPDSRAGDPESSHSLSLTNRTETPISAALFHSARREAHDHGQRGRRG
jgi:hypothetical protein